MLSDSVKAVLLAMMRELAHRRHDTPPTRGDSAADGERPRDSPTGRRKPDAGARGTPERRTDDLAFAFLKHSGLYPEL